MLNEVNLIGRLTRDPESKFTPNGDLVVTFGLATSEKYKNKSGEMVEKTEFHNIVAWRHTAEFVKNYIKKGALIYLKGKLQTRSWDKDGTKHYRTEIQAQKLTALGSMSKNENNGSQGGGVQPGGGSQGELDTIPF